MEDQEFERNEQMLEARRLKRLEQKRRRQMQQPLLLFTCYSDHSPV